MRSISTIGLILLMGVAFFFGGFMEKMTSPDYQFWAKLDKTMIISNAHVKETFTRVMHMLPDRDKRQKVPHK